MVEIPIFLGSVWVVMKYARGKATSSRLEEVVALCLVVTLYLEEVVAAQSRVQVLTRADSRVGEARTLYLVGQKAVLDKLLKNCT